MVYTLPDHYRAILQHSLGVDEFGQGEQYRNHFLTEPTSRDGYVCRTLCLLGLMADYGKSELTGGSILYRVTDNGKRMFFAQCPRPPRLTAAQKRYQIFLESDSSLSFREWLGIKNRRKAKEKA